MANETNYAPVKYGGNGVTCNFSFSWKALKKEEIKVVIINADGTTTTLILGDGYTVTLNDVGGSITTTTAPASGTYIVISRNTSKFQTTKYSTSTGFQGSEIEKSFDRNSLCLQEMSDTIETFREEFTEELGEANENIYNLLDTAEELVTKADNTVFLATEQANRAQQYADLAEFGMKWEPIYEANWTSSGGKYTLTLSDVPIINAVYKGTWSEKKLVKNCDIKTTDTGSVITSMEAFDGFYLTSAYVVSEYEYQHLDTASDEWIIDHNTGTYPSVTLVDTDGIVMVGTIQYISFNRIKVTFTEAVKGKAYLR